MESNLPDDLPAMHVSIAYSLNYNYIDIVFGNMQRKKAEKES